MGGCYLCEVLFVPFFFFHAHSFHFVLQHCFSCGVAHGLGTVYLVTVRAAFYLGLQSLYVCSVLEHSDHSMKCAGLGHPLIG